MSVTLIGLCSGGIPEATTATLSDTELDEVFWPLFGAEGNESDDSESGGDDEDQDDDDDDGEDEDEAEKGEQEQPLNAEEAKKLAKKNAKLRNRIRELKAAEEAARKEKETASNAGKDETERLRGEVQTLQAKLEERDSQLQQSALRQAFLESNKVQWHDPKTAMRLLDTSDIDIDEDGDVSGMDDAIKALADQHPYLVKAGTSGGDDKGGKKKSTAKGSSGEGGTKRKKDSDGVDREALIKKYPALR